VLDYVDAVGPGERGLATGLRSADAATDQRGERDQEQRDSQLNGG
jgi:hypothetical protein